MLGSPLILGEWNKIRGCCGIIADVRLSRMDAVLSFESEKESECDCRKCSIVSFSQDVKFSKFYSIKFHVT